eukprot:scaffold229278_cov31-Prasinocladus_malaysianus.AAC.6
MLSHRKVQCVVRLATQAQHGNSRGLVISGDDVQCFDHSAVLGVSLAVQDADSMQVDVLGHTKGEAAESGRDVGPVAVAIS